MGKLVVLKKKIDNGFLFFAHGIRKLTAVILMVMLVAVTIQVFGRLLKLTTPWTEEVATYSLIWLTYLGSIICVIKGEHLCVDLFLARYKPAQRRVAQVFIDLVITTFCAIMFIFGVQLCMNPVIITGRTPALNISRVYIYLSLPISMGFSLLYIVYDLIVSVIDLATGGKLVSDEELEAKVADYEAK